MRVLVTGAAGFIGFHTARRLIERGDEVVGFDVVNDYYDPTLKEARLRLLEETARGANGAWAFQRADLADEAVVRACFDEHGFDRVIHLAAQAGVRHSLTHPHDYVRSNIVAFTNVLEASRYAEVPHLTYASTSSVYGANTAMPFSEHEFGMGVLGGMPEPGSYDAVVLAVGHRQFAELGAEAIRALGKPEAVFFDVKGVFDKDASSGRI
jgi:UDP-glucuronate 4-epimerase